MTLEIDINKPGIDLKAVIDAARHHDQVNLLDGQKLVAKVVSSTSSNSDRSKLFGMMKGQFEMKSDFDALSDEEMGLVDDEFLKNGKVK